MAHKLTSSMDNLFQEIDNIVNDENLLDSPVTPSPITPFTKGSFNNSSKGKKDISKNDESDLRSSNDDVDNFIDSLNDFNPSPKMKEKKNPKKIVSKPKKQSGEKRNCDVLYVGGTSFPMGLNDALKSNNRCDNIFCLDCNFTIKVYNNYRWSKNINYLFFRNNFPEKINVKLRRKKGFACYACQCKWVSVSVKEIKDCSDVSNGSKIHNWRCGGHYI